MSLQEGNKSEPTTEKSGALGIKKRREMEVQELEKKSEEMADNE